MNSAPSSSTGTNNPQVLLQRPGPGVIEATAVIPRQLGDIGPAGLEALGHNRVHGEGHGDLNPRRIEAEVEASRSCEETDSLRCHTSFA